MGVPLDKRIYNSIIDTFGKYGELGEALEVFEKMQQEGIKPDITTWNSLNKWHCKFGDVANALELFAKMLEQWYGRFLDAEECINALKLEGIQLSASVFSVLANAYAQRVCSPFIGILNF
ncbi:hypothetical protein ACSBR1_039748 [Camellia fascicularis]